MMYRFRRGTDDDRSPGDQFKDVKDGSRLALAILALYLVGREPADAGVNTPARGCGQSERDLAAPWSVPDGHFGR